MEKITVNGQLYDYVLDYRDQHHLRKSFNDLTREVFGFDFENWYSKGYWGAQYIPYSLLDGDKVVSNISVSLIKFKVNGKKKTLLQIGTVMTTPEYRHQGMSRTLLEKVLNEWRGNCDLIYLFANETVLDFYPKFGFKHVEQYQYSKEVRPKNTDLTAVKLDMSNPKNEELVRNTINSSIPISPLSMIDNTSLVMFYCTSFLANNVHYIKELGAVVIADLDGKTLCLKDIFCEKTVAVDDVIFALCEPNTIQVVLEFTPSEKTSYREKILVPDDVLFILDDKNNAFENQKWMFPVLSHA